MGVLPCPDWFSADFVLAKDLLEFYAINVRSALNLRFNNARKNESKGY